MKAFFTLVFIYFCLSAMESYSEEGIQNPKAKVQLKADSINVKQGDSLPKNSININGHLNAVTIANDNLLVKNLDTEPKKAANTIKINGDSNSVNINQKNKASNVNIQQNGNGNQVNVSQSNQGQ